MRYFAFLLILALSSGVGYSYPPVSISELSGVICQVDEDGNTVECDEVNSQLPENLETNGAVVSDEYVCIDITYRTGSILKQTYELMQCAFQLRSGRLCPVLQKSNDVPKCIESSPKPKPIPTTTTPETPSGLYCIVDDEDNTVECNRRNSVLPSDLIAGEYSSTNDYVCIDVTYDTGLFLFQQSHHVRQCAFNVNSEDELCDVLKDNNDVPSCTLSPPYTTPIVEPSGLYCIVDDVDNTVECNRRNSVLPSDLNAGEYSNTNDYVCIDVTYNTGFFLLQQSHHVRQCALNVNSEDELCDVLKDNNDVPSCTQSAPYTTSTVEPPSGVFCEVNSDGYKVECSKANSVLPEELNLGGAERSNQFACISATYKVGIFLLETQYTIQQCAYELSGGQDLCTVLRGHNNVLECREWKPSENGLKSHHRN